MKSMLKTILAVLIAALLLGGVFALIDKGEKKNEDESEDKAPTVNDGTGEDDGGDAEPTVNVIGGTQGFTTDFSDMTVVEHDTDQMRLKNNTDTILPTQLFAENGYGDISVADGKLKYECTMSASSSTYPKFKIKPLEYNSGKLYLYQFKVLTVDFDIEYDVDPDTEYASAFCALFNTRSDSSGSTVCSNSDYYRFDNSGRGHYTFVYYDTGELSTMKIFVYKDGVLVNTVSNFIYSDYDEYDFYVSCLNLELTRNQGDTVSVDNVEFHYFDEDYTGPIMDLVENPNVNLTTCKDSVLYGG